MNGLFSYTELKNMCVRELVTLDDVIEDIQFLRGSGNGGES